MKDEVNLFSFILTCSKQDLKGLQVNINVPEEYANKIAPVTIQNLIENAIKHNIIDPPHLL